MSASAPNAISDELGCTSFPASDDVIISKILRMKEILLAAGEKPTTEEPTTKRVPHGSGSAHIGGVFRPVESCMESRESSLSNLTINKKRILNESTTGSMTPPASVVSTSVAEDCSSSCSEQNSQGSVATIDPPPFKRQRVPSLLVIAHDETPANVGKALLDPPFTTLGANSNVRGQKTLLLACPADEMMLSPLHVLIRKQIEVFCATSVEVSRPSPGRKRPIQLNQVGLRCIHCKESCDGSRAKRSVCYPTSLARIYHAVSDMKCVSTGHFNHCANLPASVREQLLCLQGDKTCKSTATAAGGSRKYRASATQYYSYAARYMGLVDRNGGVFLSSSCDLPNGTRMMASADAAPVAVDPCLSRTPTTTGQRKPASILRVGTREPPSTAVTAKRSISEADTSRTISPNTSPVHMDTETVTRMENSTLPKVLSCMEDSDNLNRLHCFLRKHVEFFAATEQDVNAPAPGRRNRIQLGQVGLRCIHCANKPSSRVKRSVCYPPLVSGIYHACSNMKFDHFPICPHLPVSERNMFAELRSQSRRQASTSDKSRKSATCTAAYYKRSAVQAGLVDSSQGIRFAGKVQPSPRAERDSSFEGISALVMAATNSASLQVSI